MTDPLAEVIGLLQPRAVFSRRITGAGRWGVRYSAFGEPSFCAVLEGSCRLAVDGNRPPTLEAGDFVLLPATPGFTMSGFDPTKFERLDPKVMSKVVLDRRSARQIGGAVAFGILRALQPHCRPATNGIPAGLADGGRQDLLRRQDMTVGQVAERVGYASASTFHRVQPPRRPAARSLRARGIDARM